MRHLLILCLVFLSGCSDPSLSYYDRPTGYMLYAYNYLGYTERKDRQELKELLGVDPVNTEWCAAFVNAVLHNEGLPGSESVSDHPLMARSFTSYGEKVDTPKAGDIVVLPRGYLSWQGHVGFYVGENIINGIHYYVILSGNDSNSVKLNYYQSSKVIAVRRPISATPSERLARSWRERIQAGLQSLLLARYDQSQHTPPDWLL